MSETNASEIMHDELHKNLHLGLVKATAAREAYKWLKVLKEENGHEKAAELTAPRLKAYIKMLDPEKAHKRAVEAAIKAEMEKESKDLNKSSAASAHADEGLPLVLLAKK